MFGKILYLSDNKAFLQYTGNKETGGDLLNLHVIFENGTERILGEITEVRNDEIEVHFLGEYDSNGYHSGIIRKATFNSKVRFINQKELIELVGVDNKEAFILGESATYSSFKICPKINEMFSNHLCIFGNSGSGKTCGAARIVQNILNNKYFPKTNANLIFFDSFGEYKNAFKDIKNINSGYNYKFITSRVVDPTDTIIDIPTNLLTVDDLAILLQADKHTQLTMIDRAIKYAKIFSLDTPEANKYKNNIIAKAILTVLYSTSTTKQKKDDIFAIIETCHTNEFNFDSTIPGIGYTRNFSECFGIDSKGRFGEEVLITNYVLEHIDENMSEMTPPEDATYSLRELSKALEFTLISEGFNQNKNMHDDAQLLRVRLNNVVNHEVGTYFTKGYKSANEFADALVRINGNKAQIININLEGLDDTFAKAIVKIYSRIIFDYLKENAYRAKNPFHLFLEEAHRYIQHDTDVFLIGYNIFDRIAKEGRKYGCILDIISQRPVEISDTVVAQCSNFLIFKMTHPKDIKYIEEMLPNISTDVIEKMKVLVPGTCVSFGSAFKIPMICKVQMPSPRPFSASCDVASSWENLNNN